MLLVIAAVAVVLTVWCITKLNNALWNSPPPTHTNRSQDRSFTASRPTATTHFGGGSQPLARDYLGARVASDYRGTGAPTGATSWGVQPAPLSTGPRPAHHDIFTQQESEVSGDLIPSAPPSYLAAVTDEDLPPPYPGVNPEKDTKS